MLPGKTSYKPFLIAWNMTRQCNLRCRHCYMDAGEFTSQEIRLKPDTLSLERGYQTLGTGHQVLAWAGHRDTPSDLSDEIISPPSFQGFGLGTNYQVPAFEGAAGGFTELTREEGFRLIDEIAAVNPEAILVLTGGEPLLYPHTLDFAGYASKKGLMVVVGTNGLLLDDPMVKRLVKSGVSGVGVSLDSIDPSIHDAFRGYPGAWRRAVEALERCRRHGLPFQIHHSVLSFNWGDVWEMVEFAHHQGARVVNFFFMVCTGRGERLTDITPEQYEEVLSTLIDLEGRYPGMMIRARCAPHFKRIAYQKDPHSPITKAEGYLGGGCLAGTHYCRIAPDGEMTPCPYMPLSVGNVRRERFSEVWENAAVFQDLRRPQLKGKCGECEYGELCGGCRARPYASHGDYLDEDPWCQYEPKGGEKIGGAEMREETGIEWTKEAEARLHRLPFFLRGMIQGNVEKYAKGHGISSITPELLDELRRRRFGDKMPEMPGLGNTGSNAQGGGVAADFTIRSSKEVMSQKQESRSENEESVKTLPWTKEASRRLEAIPEFMRGIFREAAEEFARDKGHLEVNIEVWQKLEEIEECRDRPSGLPSSRQGMEWTEEALREIESRYAGRPMFLKDFMAGILKEDIEMFARSKGITRIDGEVLCAAAGEGKGNVAWSPEAWERLQRAPDFIRSGIKKAAERRAMRMGVPTITSELLTQFRNMAMMKAVKRIKALGYHELTFDAFDYAKENFKKIKNNLEARERLDEIKEYVTSKGKVGLIDEKMLKKMKEYLKE